MRAKLTVLRRAASLPPRLGSRRARKRRERFCPFLFKLTLALQPRDGLARAGDDDALHMYRTNTGTLLKTLYSKKYGCSCVTFTHASQALLYASKAGVTK